MAEETKVADKPAKTKAAVTPIGLREFGTQAHVYGQFNAYVPDGTTKEQLTDPALWVHVASKLRAGSEIRCMPEDLSFVGRLIVLYQLGSVVRVGLESFTLFGETNVDAPDERYIVVSYGAQGQFAVRDTVENKLVFKAIRSRSAAYRQIDEHVRALAS